MILNSPTISGSLTVTGNTTLSGSINVVGGLTGTSSFATTAISSSYSATATSSSYALASTSASYALASTSASYALASTSASYGLNALTSSNSTTASSADTLYVRNNATVLGSITAQTLVVQTVTSSILFSTGSNKLGSLLTNTQELTGSVGITGSLSVVTTGTEFQVNASGVNIGNALTDSHIISGSLRVNPNGLFVSSSGNVGIGTTNPAGNRKLTVAGGAQLTYEDNSGASFNIVPGATGQAGADLNLSYYTGTDYGPLTFTLGGSERMRIISTGNILVNTTSNYNLGNDSNKGIIINAAATFAPYISFRVGDANKGVIYANSAEMLLYAQANIPMIFGTNDTERMRIDSSGLITAPYITGKSFSMTSGGGTGTAITDTGIYVSSGDWGGFGRSSTYLITFSANPNNGGSGEYSAVHVGYMSVYTGWNGSAVTTYIDYTQVASGNNIGVLTLSPRFWNGSTESSNVARGSISGNQIRIKISGYNASFTGANQALYIQKIITSG